MRTSSPFYSHKRVSCLPRKRASSSSYLHEPVPHPTSTNESFILLPRKSSITNPLASHNANEYLTRTPRTSPLSYVRERILIRPSLTSPWSELRDPTPHPICTNGVPCPIRMPAGSSSELRERALVSPPRDRAFQPTLTTSLLVLPPRTNPCTTFVKESFPTLQTN